MMVALPQSAVIHVEGDIMPPTLHDGMGLVAKRLEHIPTAISPRSTLHERAAI
jgi:hypothetical protein